MIVGLIVGLVLGTGFGVIVAALVWAAAERDHGRTQR